MRRYRPNDSVRGMYEHVRGILKHNISLKLDKKGNILTSFQTYSTQGILKDTQNYSNLLNSQVLKDKILNSVIRFSTQ